MTPRSASATSAAEPSHRPNLALGMILAVLLTLLYATLATLVLRFGRPNADEGFYALISSEVMQGKLLYRDLAYTQTPLLPYIQGAVMSVIGFGVFEQRLLNVLLSSAALALALHLWRKRELRTSEWLPLATLWVFALPILYFCTIGKAYAMTQLALVVAAAALVWRGKLVRRLILLSIAGVVAIGCRLPAGPAVLILWGAFAFHHRDAISRSALIGFPLALGLLAFAPLILPAPANAWFWTWAYHGKSAIPRAPLATLAELGFIAPGIALIALLTLAGVAYRRFHVPTVHLGVFLAGLVGAVLNAVLSGVYAEYAVPFLGLVVLGAGLLLPSLNLPRRIIASALVLGIATTAFGLRQTNSYRGPTAYLADVEAAAAFVAAHTVPQGTVLTPMPEIALAAGRPVVPRSEMGKFSITGEILPQEAFAHRVIFFGELVFIVENQFPAAVVLSANERWNFRRSIPSLNWFADADYAKFVQALESRYVRTYTNPSYIVYLPRVRMEPSPLQLTGTTLDGSSRNP